MTAVFDSEVVFDGGHQTAFDLPSDQTVFFHRVPEGTRGEPRTSFHFDLGADLDYGRLSEHSSFGGGRWMVGTP